MPILRPNSAQAPAANARTGEHGFSILELLIVLAIMALMLSVVGGRMIDNIEGAHFVRTAEAAVADVLIIRADAVMSAQPRTLVTDGASPADIENRLQSTLRRYDVPADWNVGGDLIEISAGGVCSGGVISLTNPQGRRIVFRLEAPRCQPERLSLGI